MVEWTEQRLGYGFGLLGGVLIAIGGLASLVLGTVELVLGRPHGALNAASEAVLLLVVGGLAIFFAWLGHGDWRLRPISTGVVLAVLAFLGWLVVGVGANLLALLGSLFGFLGGVLFLVEPAKQAASSVVHAS